ncbi:hypothetical protein [Puniceicoccus vermicola]|uniref:Uncharacterized protein n=1 Tax=Puniceicoccus vermicola TaxID=388746 RepID=A0A7X1E7L7_9BACT|nr:hypothetical protein [Puniceicoccus vermicola]MBC2603877.1 hypothetical protein [Puniceicoccus vermicola]
MNRWAVTRLNVESRMSLLRYPKIRSLCGGLKCGSRALKQPTHSGAWLQPCPRTLRNGQLLFSESLPQSGTASLIRWWALKQPTHSGARLQPCPRTHRNGKPLFSESLPQSGHASLIRWWALKQPTHNPRFPNEFRAPLETLFTRTSRILSQR